MPLHPPVEIEKQTVSQVISDIANEGFSITDNFLPADLIKALYDEAKRLNEAGATGLAGTGRGSSARQDDQLRGDLIYWLDDTVQSNQISPAQLRYLQEMQALREEINRNFYLGLFDFECHFAIYPPGKFYRKHLDQFRPESSNPLIQKQQRQISCILYLNQQWQREDGGQLKIFLDGENATPCIAIEPLGGRLVTFLSSRFWHEVLPSNRERVSLTGWLRTRA